MGEGSDRIQKTQSYITKEITRFLTHHFTNGAGRDLIYKVSLNTTEAWNYGSFTSKSSRL